jgi:predicted nucleic acid-binding protein
MSTTTELLLDAWPILEWLKGRQPASAAFRKLIEAAVSGQLAFSMCRMNYGEVLYSIKKDFPANRVESAKLAFFEIPIKLHSVDDLLIDEAVELKGVYSISFADAFAAALAPRLDLQLVTGDPEFLALKSIGLRLLWVAA